MESRKIVLLEPSTTEDLWKIKAFDIYILTQLIWKESLVTLRNTLAFLYSFIQSYILQKMSLNPKWKKMWL